MERNVDDHKPQMCHRSLTLHWVSAEVWLAAQGYEVWSSRPGGKSWMRQGALRSDLVSKLARHPFIAQTGRLGIHNLLQLSSGTILGVADGTIYRSTDQGTSFSAAFSSFQGRRPLRMGICQDNLARVYYGEYLVNQERRAIQLWRSEDDALNWKPIFTWPSGSIAHIHFVQFDSYEKVLWLGTGDNDDECQLLRSEDGGESYETIGGGTQLWRAGSVVFTPEAIIWGTDIGFDHNDQRNYIIRMDRVSRSLQTVRPIDGPAYYSTQLSDGTIAIGTCVEQANRLNDSCLHLYWSKAQTEWHDLRLWPKLMAPQIAGPATITFPLNGTSLNRLLFNVHLTQWKYNGALFELAL